MTIATGNSERKTADSVDRYGLRRALLDRLSGPGGYYNAGNLIGLATGLFLQINNSSEHAARAAAVYLAGDAGGAMLTAATLVFMVSGEVYHRAWGNGFPPDIRLNRLADFLSGLGALALGASLFILGQPFLAATAGLLHALGKFGSAAHGSGPSSPLNWPRLFRLAVIASRGPAILAAVFQIVTLMPAALRDAALLPILAPSTLLLCYLLWVRADAFLLKN